VARLECPTTPSNAQILFRTFQNTFGKPLQEFKALSEGVTKRICYDVNESATGRGWTMWLTLNDFERQIQNWEDSGNPSRRYLRDEPELPDAVKSHGYHYVKKDGKCQWEYLNPENHRWKRLEGQRQTVLKHYDFDKPHK